MGVNTQEYVPQLSCKAGLGVKYANHSLHATVITHMFNTLLTFQKKSLLRHQVISFKALRSYERTLSAQQQAVTAFINNIVSDPLTSPTISAKNKHNSGSSSTLSGVFNNCTITLTQS